MAARARLTDREIRATFRVRFRRSLVLAGASHAQLCRALGVSKEGVRNWGRGRCLPDARKLAHLAIELGVSADYLLGIEDQP